MSHKSRGIRKPTQEIVMDWFESNPASHVRSGQLAKALKMTPTTIADALGKLAALGKLHREKKTVAGEERAGARAEQWEYSLPSISTVAQRREPKPFKPLKTATAFRRETAIEQAPSIIVPALQQPQPEVGQNTGSLGSDRHLRADSLPEAQAVTQPPKPDEKPVEAGGDVTAEAAPEPATLPAPAYDPRQVSFNEGDRAYALAVRNHNLIAAICEAIGFDDDQPTEALVEHVKELKERAGKAEANLESIASAEQKFCAWVADQFPVSRPSPRNLYECTQTLDAWKEGQENRLTNLQSNAAEYTPQPDPFAGAEYAIAFPEDLYPTPEAALNAAQHIHDAESLNGNTIVAVRPIGKIAMKPTLVPMGEAA